MKPAVTVPNVSHNPYFNRWFSAMEMDIGLSKRASVSHNPYFNRWFSAIVNDGYIRNSFSVTILILIDGFLQ